jgi:hypothetical protein
LWLALPQLCREATIGSKCAGRREQVRQGLCTCDRCGMIQSGATCCWEGRGWRTSCAASCPLTAAAESRCCAAWTTAAAARLCGGL